MSAAGGTTTLELHVKADKAGLTELQTAFASLNASITANLDKLGAASRAVSLGGAQELAQLKSQIAELKGGLGTVQQLIVETGSKAEEAAKKRMVASTQATEASKAASAAMKLEAQNARDLHSAVRGLAGGVGALWTTYGSFLPLVAGFALSAGLKKAVEVGSEFTYQMQFAGAVSGATQAEIQKLSGAYEVLSEKSMFSATQIAQGNRVLAQAGFSAADSLKLMPDLLKFSTVGEIEMGHAAEIAAGQMHAFGLTVDELPHMLDSTAKAAAVSQTTISEMGQALRQASTVAQQYGVNVDEMNSLLAVLAQRNIRGSAAGTALMNMFRELDPQTAKAKVAFKELGIAIDDGAGGYKKIIPLIQEFADKFGQYDKISQQRLSDSLFNNRGSKAFLNAIAEGRGALQQFFGELQNSDGYLKKVDEQLQYTFKYQAKESINAFQVAMIEAFNAIEPSLTDMLRGFQDLAKDQGFREFLKDTASGFMLIATAVGNLVAAVVLLANMTGISALFERIAAVGRSLGNGAADIKDLANGQGSVSMNGTSGLALGRVSRNLNMPTEDEMQIAMLQRKARELKIELEGAAQAERNLMREMERGNLATGGAQGYGNANVGTIKAIGVLHYDPDARKEAEKQAQADVALEVSKYHEMLQVQQTGFNNQLAVARAYHAAKITDDAQLAANEKDIIAAQQETEQQIYVDHIAKLIQLRAKVGSDAKERAKIDAEISKAQEEQYRRIETQHVAGIVDAAKAWTEYNAKSKGATDAITKANDELRVSIDAEKNYSTLKKDSILTMAEARQKLDEETLSRLEAEAAAWDQCKVLTAVQDAELLEIEAIKKGIAERRREIEERKGLLQEQKDVENDWRVGAIKGLNQYLDTSLSTAKLMEKGFKNAFSSLEDMLVDFVTTGKLNFKQFADSVIKDVARILVQTMVTKPLAQMLQGMLAGLFSGSGGGGGSFMNADGSTNWGGVLSSMGTLGSVGYGMFTGSGTGIAGGIGNTVGGWLGTTGMLQSAPAYTQTAGGMYVLSTDAAPAAGGSIPAGAVTAGWIAAVVAAVIANNQMFTAGWRADGQDSTAHTLGVVAYAMDRTNRALGMSDRLASLLSGSSLTTRIFGLGAEHPDAYGISGTIGGSGYTAGGWQDMSRRGGVFRHDDRWTDPTPLSSDGKSLLDKVIGGINDVTSVLGKTIGVNSSDVLKDYSHPFSIQMSENGAPVTDAELVQRLGDAVGPVLQEQIAAIFHASGDTEMEQWVTKLKGTGAEVTQTLTELVGTMQGLKDINLKGLDIHSLMDWQAAGETLTQAFDRISGQIKGFDDAFMTDAEKAGAAQDKLNSTFLDLGITVPKTNKDFYDLVHGLDLSTKAGRDMFDALMKIAPAFLVVTNATKQAIDAFNSAASSLSPKYGQYLGTQGLGAALTGFNQQLVSQGGTAWTQSQATSNIQAWIADPAQMASALAYAQSLGGDALAFLTQMLQAYGASLGNGADDVQALGKAANGAANALKQQQQQIEDWAKSKLLSTDSPLLPAEKLNFALTDYEKVVKKGDKSAFTGTADELLAAGRSYYGSSDDYTALFNRVMEDAQKLGGFKLNYSSNIAAASIDQMRSDLLIEMRLAREQNGELANQVAALLRAVQQGTEEQKETIRQSAETIANAVRNAIDTVAH